MYAKTKIHLAVGITLAILKVVWSAPDNTDLTDSGDAPGRLYRWIAIGCGALINIIIGGYAGLTNILETEGRWTQRLEFVKDESKWWTGMSTIVLVAFAMDIMAFSKGESVDATILILAAEVGIVIFVYVVQGTLHSEFRQLLWLAWTGSSRTGCNLLDGAKIRDFLIDTKGSGLMGKEIQYESKVDIPGYGTVFSPKVKQDFVTVLKQRSAAGEKTAAEVFESIGSHKLARKFVYPQHQSGQLKVSVLWGGGNCNLFSRRVSRGITGYTLERIRSSYSLINVDEMKWMFVAGGIVSRNKGLFPTRMICGLTEPIVTATAATTVTPNTILTDELETTSKWRPRPAKTSRSQYAKESVAQFSGLGGPFCAAVVEIALLMQDIPDRVVIKALQANVEQQSSQKMWEIQDLIDSIDLQEAMYVCQYMTLCAKLNWYGKNDERPDLLMGMMYAASKRLDYTISGDEEKVSDILRKELEGLDLGVQDKKSFDILFCLGAYLGINIGDRRRVISEMSSKFGPDASIQTIFSEITVPRKEKKSESVHLDVKL